MTLSLSKWKTFDYSVYNDYGNYNDQNDYSDYNDQNDYSDYNGYRDSNLGLDKDWERSSELVTQLTITDKLRNLNHDIEEYRFKIR